MLPFILYFLTGLVAVFHVYTFLTLAVYGAPFDPLELVALLGSLCMLIAAYVSLLRPQAGAKVALIGALAIWSFYGPGIAKIVRTRFDSRNKQSQFALPQGAGRTGELTMKLKSSAAPTGQRLGAHF
jgi:hypothetical protein